MKPLLKALNNMIFETTFQILSCMVTLKTEYRALGKYFDFIAHDAEQDFPIQRRVCYEARKNENSYEIAKKGKTICSNSDISRLIYTLMGEVHADAFKDIKGFISLHAGCGSFNGKRFLVVGDKGAGKSTLMTGLLYHGFQSDSDELVLIFGDETVPFPRRFHLKEKCIDILPRIRQTIERVPCITLNGTKIFSFSPSEAGFKWKIEKRRVDAIFYLSPNHGQKSRIERLPVYLMAEALMGNSFLSAAADHEKIGTLCRLADHSGCYILRAGDLVAAAFLIRETLIKEGFLR